MKTKEIVFKTLVTSYSLYFKGLHKIAPKTATRKAFELFSKPRIKKYRLKELEVLNKAQLGQIEYEGLKIMTYKWKGGNKQALLVHGWEGHAGHLGGIVEPLIKAGYTVHAFDGPAHGKSEGKFTNIFHFGNLISKLVKKHRINTLISHSFGSAASTYALNSIQFKIDNFIMITSPDKMEDVLNEYGDLMKFGYSLREDILSYVEKMYGRNPKEMQVSIHAPKMNVDKILLIHSPGDRIIPFKNAKRIYENLQNATLQAPENKGHYKILWDKEVIDNVVEFVNRKI
jgi:pimeloyl-ACP methyl ester carboxylesterase